MNVLGPDPPESARFGPFRTVSPFVRGSPDHFNNVQTGRRDWGVIGTSRSHWLARTCARRARVVKTDRSGAMTAEDTSQNYTIFCDRSQHQYVISSAHWCRSCYLFQKCAGVNRIYFFLEHPAAADAPRVPPRHACRRRRVRHVTAAAAVAEATAARRARTRCSGAAGVAQRRPARRRPRNTRTRPPHHRPTRLPCRRRALPPRLTGGGTARVWRAGQDS